MEDKIVKLEEQAKQLNNRIAELEALVKYYEEMFRLSKRRQYGVSSEKTEDYEQIGLFDEPENTADKKTSEPEYEEVVVKHRKHKGKRKEDLSNLPVETIEYELPKEEQVCPECGGDLHKMKQEVRREIEIIPATVKVVEHATNVYSCRECEKNNDHVPIIKASAPEPLIKGSVTSASLVAHIITQKYVNAVPLYRQEQDFLRNGVILSRQNMANWVIFCAENWLKPIYDHMKSSLLQNEVLHADETVLQVLKEPGKKANTNSYMWLYRTSGDAAYPIVIYEYKSTRSSAHPKAFLNDFTGYLHTDGYSGYHTLQTLTNVGCWAHMRRRFDEALKVMPVEERKDSSAFKGLDYCNRLFEFEREFSNLTPQERYAKRLESSKPIAEAFFEWAKTVNALPKSALGKAIHYTLEQRTYLENVFLDGRLELSNNRAERSIKPFVIGRKNWLFCNSEKGADSGSIIYSIIETAKENHLNPFMYICFLLTMLPKISFYDIHELLPWSSTLPDYCKSPKK